MTAIRRCRCAAALLIAMACLACGTNPRPPDIVLVTLDTFRLDHMTPSLTPALDAFAAEGLVFDAAFTTIPTTTPAHVSMFTGLHPHEHGVLRNGDRVDDESVRALGLPRRLAAAGYRTAAFVGSRVLEEPAGLDGFDRYDAPRAYIRPGAETVSAALQWLARADDDPASPVFLWVHLFDAHSPYGAWSDPAKQQAHDPAWHGWVDRSRLADPQLRAKLIGDYAQGVREVDTAFGALMEGLAARNAAEPVVCVVGDHGEFLDELLDETGFAFGHGSALGEAVLAVPLVLRVPGHESRPGRHVDAPVSVRDVYTTLAALAGLSDGGAEVEGRYDLAGPLPRERFVAAQRRRFTGRELSSSGMTPGQREFLDANAVAVTDGADLLVMDEQGRITKHTGSGASDGARVDRLSGVASAHLAASRGVPIVEQALTEEQREVLEALGYTR